LNHLCRSSISSRELVRVFQIKPLKNNRRNIP
jgi:hypothetical protein